MDNKTTQNPFPGMNPYLEDPEFWHGVHNSLIYQIRAQLNQVLPQNYVADTEHRLIVEYEEKVRPIVPDIAVLRPMSPTPVNIGGRTATLTLDEPKVLTLPESAIFTEYNEPYIVIREVRRRRSVVTIIEILSPGNKMQGTGRTSYLQKQYETLASDVHLLEIDLLRCGLHTVVPPFEAIHAEFGTWDYIVALSHSRRRDTSELWLCNLPDRLPKVKVPLREADADVGFDLQEALNRAYLEGAYHRLVDYDIPPNPPLTPSQADWVASVLCNLHPTS